MSDLSMDERRELAKGFVGALREHTGHIGSAEQAGQTGSQMFHPFEDSSATAEVVVPILVRTYRSVLDLGCNQGCWVKEFKRLGAEAIGVDGPGMGAKIEHDLTIPLDLKRKFDLVLCLEVAQHLPEDKADVLVDTAIRHASKAVIWSAATPGQGGYRHLNEQEHEYWVNKFIERGWTGVHLGSMLGPLPHAYYRKNMWEFRP